MNENGSGSFTPPPIRSVALLVYSFAVRGWRDYDLSVNQLGSIAFGGTEGEKVLQHEIRPSVWFASHDDHIPLFPLWLPQ